MSYGRFKPQRCLNGTRTLLAFIAISLVSVSTSLAQQSAQPPAYQLSPDKLQQAVAFNRALHWLHFGAQFWMLLVLWLFLATGAAARLAASITRKSRRGWLSSAIFSALLVTFVFLFALLPPAAVGHAISLHFGISLQPWGSWAADASTSLRNLVVGATFILMLAHFLLEWSPRRYWLWFSAALVPLTLIGAFILPTFIDPMYDHYEPLAATHPALVTQLERVVARTGTSIPPDRMFLQRAASKSNGINARVTGIGATKRIVVLDTTADRLPNDEILFIFGHESGHYVLHHVAKGMILAALGTFALMFLVSRLAAWLIARFGVTWGIPSLASLPGLVVLLLAITTLQYATAPISNTISRYFEHQADIYGQEAIHGLVPDPQKTAVSAFQHKGEAGLDDPNPNPLLEFWTYDHPSTARRAAFAAQYDPWAPGMKPEFFTH
jgi:Zn-dependent protease with chaperone function